MAPRVPIESELIPMDATDFIPKKPKPGYECEPSFDKLEKMTVYELRKVENFTVKN